MFVCLPCRLLLLDDVLPLPPDGQDDASGPNPEEGQRDGSQQAAAAGAAGPQAGVPMSAPLAAGDEEFDVARLRQQDLQDAVRLARQRQKLLRMVVAVLPDLDAPRPAKRGASDHGPGPGSQQQQQQQQKGCPAWVREYMRDMLVGNQQAAEVMVGSMSQVMDLLDLITEGGK